MELKEFIKKVVDDAVQAVDESSASSTREITLASRTDRRTIEFDVAVSVEEKSETGGKAGVKVLAFIEAGGKVTNESKNSTVSRVSFGVDVNTMTKQEQTIRNREIQNQFNKPPIKYT